MPKVIHGWGSSGEGGKIGPAIRKSLRLRVKEGKATLVVSGDGFSSDTNEGRELARRHPSLELSPFHQTGVTDRAREELQTEAQICLIRDIR
ncbi:MAG: hypothetical protein L0Z50_12760 [Verrucomicrobiales bacterium]|nr:hypothetical protein [Verrucomicrobiales bacterium]